VECLCKEGYVQWDSKPGVATPSQIGRVTLRICLNG